MTWFRVDDGFYSHPKTLALGTGPKRDAATSLWLLAGSWAARHLTDGHVPEHAAAALGVTRWKAAAADLVRVGLWHAAPDGWVFHQWTEHQPTRDTVESRRKRERDKKAAARASRRDRAGPVPDVSPGDTRGDSPGESVLPVPSRPVPSTTLSRSSARDAIPFSVAEGAWWSVIGRRGGKPVHAHDDVKHWRTVIEAAEGLVPDGESPRAWLEAHLTRWLDSRTSRSGPRPVWWADALQADAAAGALGNRDTKPLRPPDAPLRYVRPDGTLTDERREAERDRVTEEPRENPDWWAWKERQAS